ncbi:MAG: SH3 domain-containing protein [Pseudomonadota bacterium]
MAGTVIASHYAEPLARRMKASAELRDGPSTNSASLGRLDAGAPFDLLDDTLGWAWGYAGDDRRVGYVESAKIGR